MDITYRGASQFRWSPSTVLSLWLYRPPYESEVSETVYFGIWQDCLEGVGARPVVWHLPTQDNATLSIVMAKKATALQLPRGKGRIC